MPHQKGAVGYGHPPKEYRFKKGQCPNPKGRPRKVVPPRVEESEADILKRLDAETIMLDGVEYSRLELELRSLHKRALKGDITASKLLDRKRAAAGLQKPKEPPRPNGVLVLPAAPDPDIWEAQAYKQQAKCRVKQE
jgi:hypothetical protein